MRSSSSIASASMWTSANTALMRRPGRTSCISSPTTGSNSTSPIAPSSTRILQKEPPTIAELYEALGKPSMEQLAEVARWAVNGLAFGHHQMRFAWRTTYLCTHQTAFYEGIAGMATELIQHAAIDELHSTNLPDTAERRDGLIKQRDHWQSQLDGLEEMAPALHDADRQRLVISAHLETANQELALLETATA